MKAAVYYQAGGPEVFRYEDVPDPEPGPDGVLVRVEAISVEGGDTLTAPAGRCRQPRTSSATRRPGPCSGPVTRSAGSARGTGSSRSGPTVLTQELRVAGERFCWHIPDGLPTEVAACVLR